MQNLLEIQNALRSAPDQQLMALMQGANPTVPQWAVASELNNRKEMRDEQTRQQGLGQPTVLAQLTGAAPASTPQTNVAGMPQGVASGMAQSMAPKTNVNQNTGINTVARNANAAAPVATMASGGVLKMQDGGDPAEKTYTFIYPEGMNTPPFELGISDLDEYDAVIKAIRKLGGTIVETDTGRVMQSDTAKEIMQESSDIAEADARVPKYVPSASDLYGTDSGRFKSENATPENYVVSAGLPPAGGAMYSSPTGGQGGSTDSSLLGLPTGEFSQTSLSAIPKPKGLATLGAAGDADMLDETVGVQTAPVTPSSPGIAAGTPFDTTKYTPRLPEKPITIDARKPLMSPEAFSSGVMNDKAADAAIATAALTDTVEPKATPDIAEFAKYANQYTKMRNEREVDSVVEAAERAEIARVKAKIAKREALNTSEKELADKITAFGKYADQYTTMRNDSEVDMAVKDAERSEAARIAAKTERQNLLEEIKQNASVDQRSGLERLEAENEANLPEDMKQRLRINSYARAGRTAAEVADLLGVSVGKVLDVAAGTLGAGLLETTALGADVLSAYQAGVMGNTDSGMFYANVANKIKQFSDNTFFEDNKLPRLSTALSIPTNAEADAAAAAEQTSAMNAKIMAMPADSSVFAEGSPTEYTPAGLAAVQAKQAKRDALNLDRGPADRENDTVGILEGIASARNKARFSGSPYSTEIKNERTGAIPKVEPLVKINTSTEEPVVNTTPVDSAVVKTKQGLPLVYNDDINAWMLSNIPVDGEETAKTEDAKAIEAGTEAAALATKHFESPGTYGTYGDKTSLDTSGGVVPAQNSSGKSTFVLNNERARAKELGPVALMEYDRSQAGTAPMINDMGERGIVDQATDYLSSIKIVPPSETLANMDKFLETADLSDTQRKAYTIQRNALAAAITAGEGVDTALGVIAGALGKTLNSGAIAGNTILSIFSPEAAAVVEDNIITPVAEGTSKIMDTGLVTDNTITSSLDNFNSPPIDDGLDRTVYPQSDSALSLTAAGTRPKLRPTASSTSGGASAGASGTNTSGTNTSGAGVSAALSASAGSKGGSAGGYQDRLASILDRMDDNKERDKWLVGVDAGLRLMGSKNPNFLSAVGESGLGALQGYRQQQALNNKQEIGILSKLGDFDMAERTLQARMAIANASNAGRNSAKAKDILAVLEARRAELTGPLAPTNLTPGEQEARDAALADIDRQIGALTGVTINSTPQVVQADASDDVSFIDRIFG